MGVVKFTDYVPQTLVGVNSASPTLSAEVVTGLPIATGARPGSSFYLNENQANQLSSSTQVCHAGWYRVVKVDSAATAANIAFGYVGAQLSIPTGTLANPAPGTVPTGVDIVTSYDKALASGIAPCVFLGAVTPGNYTIVQDEGDASVQVSTATGTVGDTLIATKAGAGQATDLGATAITGTNYPQIVGVAEATWTVAGLVRTRLGFPFGGK